MDLIVKSKSILKNEIRTGQVLTIKYKKENEVITDLILVVDPNAQTVTAGGQGRANKLHAIKLKNLSPYDTLELIKQVRALRNTSGREIYDAFKASNFSTGTRNYRTYTTENIESVHRMTVGQTETDTIKTTVGNSILYGVEHNRYVVIKIDHYPTVIQEIKNVNYKIFYEGVEDTPEPIVMEFFKILHAFDPTFSISNLKYKSWDIEMDTGDNTLRTVLPLFGSEFKQLLNNVKTGIGDNDISGKTLLDTLVMAARPGGWIKTGSRTLIQKVVNMADDNVKAQLNSYLNKNYSEKVLRDFHELGQKYAFADFEGLPTDTKLAQLQIRANKVRDNRLVNYMKKNTGVYFAGAGHIELINKLKQ